MLFARLYLTKIIFVLVISNLGSWQSTLRFRLIPILSIAILEFLIRLEEN